MSVNFILGLINLFCLELELKKNEWNKLFLNVFLKFLKISYIGMRKNPKEESAEAFLMHNFLCTFNNCQSSDQFIALWQNNASAEV